jgi:hypothetical protein
MYRIAASALILAAVAGGGTALAVTGSSSAPITKSQAITFGHAVVFKEGDVPEGKLFELPPSVDEEPENRRRTEEPVRCRAVRYPRAHPIAAIRSIFTDPYGFVGSYALVMRDEALAKADAAAVASAKGRSCIARGLGEQFSIEQGRGKRDTSFARKITFVPVTRLLGPDAVVVHVLVEIPPPTELEAELRRYGAHLRLGKPRASFVHVDVALFRVGPSEIVFLTAGHRQFPAATEGRLLALLYSRAKTHKL